METIKKLLMAYGLYTLCGRIYHFMHSKPDPKKLEKIAAIFTAPGSDREAKFMGMFGFHKHEEDEDEEEVTTNRIGF